jgi:hypothetical protein
MNLVLAVLYSPVPGFPAGSAVAAVTATVTGTASGNTTRISQSAPAGETSFVFPLTVADTYTYSVQAVDGATPPNTYGTAVTGTFTITAPATVTLSLPSSVTPSQS